MKRLLLSLGLLLLATSVFADGDEFTLVSDPAAPMEQYITYDKAPYVGGRILLKGSDADIRLVCVEPDDRGCTSFQIVRTDGADNRTLLNNNVFRFSDAPAYKGSLKSHAHMNVETQIMVPFLFTRSALAICIVIPPLFLVTGVIDLAMLPYTVPNSIIQKGQMTRAVKALFTQDKKKRLGKDDFELMEFVLERLDLRE